MAQITSVRRIQFVPIRHAARSYGPFFLRPVITLLYGLLTIRPRVVVPRLNRYTIPDFWNVVFHNVVSLHFAVDARQGVSNGVAVEGSLTVLGMKIDVEGRVLHWSDLLHLNVQLSAGTVGIALSTTVRKPSQVLADAHRDGQSFGMQIAAAQVAADKRMAAFDRKEAAAATKAKRKRSRTRR